jgi:hypothetical protein
MVGEWLWPLRSQVLCEVAQRKTGLKDFGNPAIDPALCTLTKSLETEADLHPLGRFLMRNHLVQLLANRLRLTAKWTAEREALENSPIQRPLFVVGMPRTGSTFLHELLAEDPENRAPRVWEVMFPVPGNAGGKLEQARRVKKTDACLWWFRRLVPEADSVYPVRARTPHECVAIQSHTFLSEEFVATCNVPAYQKFLHSTDLTPAYQWEKQFLQHLQSVEPARRWVLKSPDHVFGLEALFKVFPDAVIIQTHRNPFEVLRSTTQLIQVLHDLYAWGQENDGAVLREARALANATERFIQFRDRHPQLADRFIDVKYTDLTSDPLSAVRRIYQQLGCPLTPEAATRMQSLAANRSRYQGGRPILSPDELRLGAAVEAGRFKSYCSRFGVSHEGGV